VITWTDEESLVLGRATRGDAADLTLYEWWRIEAGPWESEADPEKDGAAELLAGTFRNDAGWKLTFDGSRYVLDDLGPYGGENVLLFRKPGELLVFHRIPVHSFGGPCPNYEVYGWRLRGDRLSLEILDGGCREHYSREISDTPWTRID
jgi:hypothetical protein